MNERPLLFISMLIVGISTNAVAQVHASKPTKVAKTARAANLKELAAWLIKEGKDYQLFGDKRAPLFDFPPEGVPTKTRVATTMDPIRMCSLAVDKSAKSGEIKPTCIVLRAETHDLKAHQSKSWNFRFNLDGSLERAFLALGQIDGDGHGVVGTAVDTVQNVEDPAVKAKAKEELEYWSLRAYELSHKSARKSEAAPAAQNQQ